MALEAGRGGSLFLLGRSDVRVNNLPVAIRVILAGGRCLPPKVIARSGRRRTRPAIGSGAVVRMPGNDGGGAIELLGKNQTHQHVR